MTQIPLTEKILSLNFFAKQLLYHYTIALACIYNLVSGLFPALRMFHFFFPFCFVSINKNLHWLFTIVSFCCLSSVVDNDFFSVFSDSFSLSLSFYCMCVYNMLYRVCWLFSFHLRFSHLRLLVSLPSIHLQIHL